MGVSCLSPSVRRCSRGGISCRLFEHRELNVGPETPCTAAGFGLFSSAFVTRDACRCRAHQKKKTRRERPGKLKVVVTRLSREVGRLIKADPFALSNYAVTNVYEILGKVCLKRLACCARANRKHVHPCTAVCATPFSFDQGGRQLGHCEQPICSGLRQVCSDCCLSAPASRLTVSAA